MQARHLSCKSGRGSIDACLSEHSIGIHGFGPIGWGSPTAAQIEKVWWRHGWGPGWGWRRGRVLAGGPLAPLLDQSMGLRVCNW